VDVLVMVGGLMNTQGDALDRYPRYLTAEPEAVVREVISAVGRKRLIVPGLANRTFLFVQTRMMSRRGTVATIGRFMAGVWARATS
jgi:hypothetical protein